MFAVKTVQNGSHAKIAKGEFSSIKNVYFLRFSVDFCACGVDRWKVFPWGMSSAAMTMSRQINPSRFRVSCSGWFSIYFDPGMVN